MSDKAIVLSSGGADSTTCVGMAVDKFGADNVVTVSANYGQRHRRELDCAIKIAEHYKVQHYEIDLTTILQYSDCSLLANSSNEIPEGSYADQVKANDKGKVLTYVPFRNGLLLSSVAALAQSLFPDNDVDIYIGAHSDDSAGNAYADCSIEFIEAMKKSINIGTYGQVFVVAPLNKMTKAQVITKGLELNVPYEMTWSCYNGRDKACGNCGTCLDRLAAFEANGVKDPIEYEI